MIVRENGMGRALSDTGGARSSLALRNSALSARDAATSAWRERIVSKICCVVTLSPPGGIVPADPAVPCLVLLILDIFGSCWWDNVLDRGPRWAPNVLVG